MGYFGTNEDLPTLLEIRAGQWRGYYELGKLRYLHLGDTEVIRMIYPAVRDRHWRTAPAIILDEQLELQVDSFVIEYRARYQLEDIDYQAHYRVEGTRDGQISMQMKGEALSNFWSNRIGLCVHHPIESCRGKAVHIEHVNGQQQEYHFPARVSPHQPFLDIAAMHWSPSASHTVTLRFEGETFETEDQRNWTDHSYKTYGTPLARPFPVHIPSGQRLEQHIYLHYADSGSHLGTEAPNLTISIEDQVFPFPALGTTIEAGHPAPMIPPFLDHLDVWVDLSDPNVNTWMKSIPSDSTRFCLNVYLNEVEALASFIPQLVATTASLKQICFLSKEHAVLDAASRALIYQQVKSALPNLLVGFGTDGFFAELNRNWPTGSPADFLQFPITPQVHAQDTRTLIENLMAQREVLLSAQARSAGCPIQVAPITLRWRYEPQTLDRQDARQHSSFIAAWTLLSIKYLAPSNRLSYYTLTGPTGILDDLLHYAPLGHQLQQLAHFKPVRIIDTRSSKPLQADVLLLENEAGQRMAIWVNFSTAPLEVQLEGHWIVLPPEGIYCLHLDQPV